MKIKKFLLIVMGLIVLSGCTKLNDLSYKDIISLDYGNKNANTFRKGYKFYIPKGLHLKFAGDNYAVISSKDYNYYVYFDLVAFNSKNKTNYEINDNIVYSDIIKEDEKEGYIEITLREEKEYLIEIMYNYAKIEVMVDEDRVKDALLKSMSILKSVSYDNDVIFKLLKEDKITKKEEVYNFFEKVKNNSDLLNYIEEKNDDIIDEIIDTDYIN